MHALASRLAVPGILLIAACSHEITSPTPELASVAPDLACTGPSASRMDGITTVTLSGSDFTPMPSKTLTNQRELLLPKVTLGPVAALPGGMLPAAAVDIADDPASPADSRVHWTSETEMAFDVNPADMLPSGVFDVTVTNPDKQHASTLSQVLALIPPPIVTAANPMAICDDQSNQNVMITGTNFLVYDGAAPTVTLVTPTGSLTYTATFQPGDCMAIPGNFTEHDVQLCTAIEIVIPQGAIAVNASTMISLTVTNPAPADCSSSTAFQLTIDAPPHVDSVVPSTICAGGAQITVNGSNFLPGATVELVCPGVTITATTVTINSSGTQLSATFGGGAPADADCEVIVKNADGCEDVPPPHKTVHVSPGPIAFFVDPDVVYNGINTVITIYATTITWPVSVTIQLGGTMTTLTTLPEDINHPNRVQAIVPIGQAPGTYDIILSDALNCPTLLPAGLTVTATKSLVLKSIVPSFGETGTDTAVEIFRDTTSTVPFAATPRAYLNPHNGTPTDVAVALESVAFLDSDRITGIVPAATPAHVYDVIVVNPDGTVGVLDSGYTETATAPPEIDNAVPSSIVDLAGQNVTLVGTSFAAGDTISVTCKDPMGNFSMPPVTSVAPTCTGTSCTQGITINGAQLALGSVCVVRLTNPDGTYSDYSAIGVTNSSLNLTAPVAGPDMVVGRRALSAATGFATRANRFVYALGGDDGTTAGALDSVELAPVDPFGTIGAWSIEPPALASKRTLAGAVTIGRYIYYAGGNDGTAPTASAERALILSPQESPQITDLDMQLSATAGLDPGTYHYRVAAVFAANDPDNPGGESLASDELTVKVPSFPGKKVVLTLVWRAPVDVLGNPLPNVVGYHIYRSALDGAPGSEVDYATTPTPTPTTYADSGTGTLGTATPLPLGSTGRWASLPAMTTCSVASTACSVREGLALASAPDPAAANTRYVYALLGRDATQALASYEYLTVTVAANGHQTVGTAWTPGTAASAHARWQLGAWTVDNAVASFYASDTWVFFGGGETFAGLGQRTVEAGQVTAGGQLTIAADTAVADFGATIAGYGVCAANGQLFTFGGNNAMPSSGAASATLAQPPPALAAGAWNAEGLTMTHARYLLGSAVQSSFIFLLGGQTDEPSPASKTTELVIW